MSSVIDIYISMGHINDRPTYYSEEVLITLPIDQLIHTLLQSSTNNIRMKTDYLTNSLNKRPYY